MSITVSLDQETEKAIELKAARLGMSSSQYVTILAEKSAGTKMGRTSKKSQATPSNSANSASPLKEMIKRADPAELKAHGITIPEHKFESGADLLVILEGGGLLGFYGDPSVDSTLLARQLREKAQTRDWS